MDSFYDINDPRGQLIKDRKGQFLGPITPDDYDALQAENKVLREACEAALAYLEDAPEPLTRSATEQQSLVMTQLRQALRGEG